MLRDRQRGASGLMIAVVLVLFAVVLLVARVLTRMGDTAQDKNDTITSLVRAQTALDQFVAAGGSNARLPCPANPALDTGVESPAAATGSCDFPGGTVPWSTIGLRRDDAYDAWGRKLSYRVYTDNKGNLVQLGGASMVNCYLDPANPNESVSGPAVACATDHSTSRLDFLSNGKGLQLTDMGVDHTPANNDPTAYVVISHGPTGFGGYTAAGVQLQTPSGDEKDNTKNTGPFHIEAWSDPDTAATSNSHFDDLIVYRTIADLATKASVQARAWPAPSVASATFNNAAGTGFVLALTRLFRGNTNAVNFGTITANGLSGGSAADIVLDTSGSTPALGIGGGADTQLSSSSSESIRFALNDSHASALKIGITLSSFGTYIATVPAVGTFTYTERVKFEFFNNGSLVNTVLKTACSTEQAVVTYTITPAPTTSFDAVVVTPLSAPSSPTGSPGDTSFSVAAINFCSAGGSCPTGISPAVACP